MREVLTVMDMGVEHIELFGKMIAASVTEAPQNYSITPEFASEYTSSDRFMTGMAKSIIANKAGRFVVLDGSDQLLGGVETVPRDSSLRIANMYVIPAARSHGIGDLLLSACEERALYDGCATLSLVVGSKNYGAINFYVRHGFTPFNPPEIQPWDIHTGIYGEVLVKGL